MTQHFGGAPARAIHATRSASPASGPVRNPITTGGHTFRAKFKSSKAANLVKCESLLELQAAQLLEFAKSITHVSHQPRRLKIRLDGRVRPYTPDFEARRASGGHLLIEVKPQELATLPHLRAKFAAAAEVAREQGDWFIVLTERQIRRGGTPCMRRLLDLRRDWMLERLGGPATDETMDTLAQSFWASNAALRDAFAGGQRHSVAATLRLLGAKDATSTLDALLATRTLAWPVAQKISRSTLVHAYTEADDAQLFI